MIDKRDLIDAGIIDADELKSAGSVADEFLSASVTSVVSGTITVSGVDLQNPDTAPEPNDIVVIAGNTAADGTYTVASIVDNAHLTINESIADGTGGAASFRHPAGAMAVGVDPTALSQTIKNWLQGVIEDLDAAITGGGVTENQHELLDTRTHLLAENHHLQVTRALGKVVNVTAWTDDTETTRVREVQITHTLGKVSGIVEIQYNAIGAEKSRSTKTINRISGKVDSIDAVETP